MAGSVNLNQLAKVNTERNLGIKIMPAVDQAEAFLLLETDRAQAYVRSAVFNGCRSVLRKRGRDRQFVLAEPQAESAEARVLLTEEHQAVLTAMRGLPDRQREAVALRYCLDMPVDEVAKAMGISQGTVKSATSRGIAALGRMLKGDS